MLKDIKHLFKHSAIYGLANILGKAVGFLMIPVYTRFISPEDYGVLEILDVSINIIGLFIGMGISNAVIRFFHLYEDEILKRRVISSAVLLMFLLGGLTALCGWYFAPFLSRILFQNDYVFFIRLIVITFAFNTILEIPLSYIRAMEQSAFFGVIAIGRLILGLSLNIYFVVLLEKGIAGILYSGIITSIIFTCFLVISTLYRVGMTFDYQISRQMLTFGAPLIFNRLGMFIINWGDRFFLNISAGLAQVGIYSLGYKFGFMISFLVGQPFFMIWSVRRYLLINEKNGEKIYGEIFFLYCLVLLTIWLLLSLFSPEIITVFAHSRYYEAHTVIPVIALAYVFREFSDFFNGILLIEKETARLGSMTMIASGICLLSYLFFIPRFGIMGAAIATLSTFVFMSLLSWFQAQRTRGINYQLKKCFPAIFSALLLWGASIALAEFFHGLLLIGGKLLLFLLFPLFVLRFLVSAEQQQGLWRFCHKKLTSISAGSNNDASS
jgi:O-antigen/teichoic acid export membrane protein